MEIKNVVTGQVLFSAEVESWKKLVEQAVKEGAYLEGANLEGAYLYGANLKGAYLEGANLEGANLEGAYLYGANLKGAYLYGAYLYGANLEGANLEGANLEGANLYGANLKGANLYGANLPKFQLPEGTLVGWKKLRGGVIAKLEIPKESKRTASLVGNKCRAEYVVVLELFGSNVGVSQYNNKTEYIVGESVYPDKYDPDVRVECTNGIHFFTERQEAENY